tara:strand:+ start:550 stop:1437 length:888 start_codon:yes stop_codon:yes gene_type:complete
MSINLNYLIKHKKKEFDDFYRILLGKILSKDVLSQAMRYGSMNGGKRIRPFIVSIFADIANVPKKKYLYVSSAIESIHSYSLIHDDLPSMDNDDFRRGKPSLHKKYSEAIAILAGDALHDLAYEILSNNKIHKNSDIKIKLIKNLSIILGLKGLAGGQSLDLLFENKKTSNKKIIQMYSMKTSALFSFCCSSPFIIAKKNDKEIKFAEDFGNLYGLIFQIIDDIIDHTENFKVLGKTPGKDKRQGKSTFLSNSTQNKAVQYCHEEINNFINNKKKYFDKWKILEKILLNNIEHYL